MKEIVGNDWDLEWYLTGRTGESKSAEASATQAWVIAVRHLVGLGLSTRGFVYVHRARQINSSGR